MKTAVCKEKSALSWPEAIKQKVEAMRFGSVQITVHDGRVTVVESMEKTRLSRQQTLQLGSD